MRLLLVTHEHGYDSSATAPGDLRAVNAGVFAVEILKGHPDDQVVVAVSVEVGGNQ